jgi:ATP-binding cassette subfamily C (CFTR/MRP) protein 10
VRSLDNAYTPAFDSLCGYHSSNALPFPQIPGPLNAFPWVLNGLIEAWVSLKRVQIYLLSVELEPLEDVRPTQGGADIDGTQPKPDDMGLQPVSPCPAGEELVHIQQATYTWGVKDSEAGDTFHLQIDDFVVRAGELIVVVGLVGSGKSSLLQV